jgi:hypothetical protein
MRLSRHVPGSSLLKRLIALLTTLLLVVPASVAASSNKAPRNQPTYSYDAQYASATPSPNARRDANDARPDPGTGSVGSVRNLCNWCGLTAAG